MTITDKLEVLPRATTLIGDEWLTKGVEDFEHRNSFTGAPQRTIPLAGPTEVDAAVATARAALREWSAWPADRRRDLLLRIADLVVAHADELSTILILETGMIAQQAKGMSSRLVGEYFKYYAGWVEKLEGSVIPAYPGPALDYTLPEPYGVVAAIIPWNGPLTPIGMKVAPALAAGNCVVLKPSELAPFSSARFGQLCLEAGLPPGVLNVVPGNHSAGEALVGHPGIDKITFTGGGATAEKVLVGASRYQTPVVLELGGKSANLIFADADLSRAVPFSAMASMIRSGQGCLLPTRLLVEDSIYDDVVGGVTKVIASLQIGDPFDDATQVGPVVSASHCARIEGVIQRALDERSGSLLTGGNRLGGDLADGYFIAPTVFGEVDNTSALAQEEIFGPVLSVLRFTHAEEAVTVANGTRYGLGAYLWTNDLTRAHRLARQLRAGSVCINGLAMPTNAPFGGIGASGYGREGGRAGIDEFLRTKNVFVQL